MCSHRLDDVQDVCDRIAILHEGELQELGEVDALVQIANRVQVQASGLALTDELRNDLAAVFAKHGGEPGECRPPEHDVGRALPAHCQGKQGASRPALSAG